MWAHARRSVRVNRAGFHVIRVWGCAAGLAGRVAGFSRPSAHRLCGFCRVHSVLPREVGLARVTRGLSMNQERAARLDQQAVDAAISRVLAAERASREAMAACRREAEEIIARAGAAAAAVGHRLEARVSAAHAVADRGIERALAALRAPPTRDDEVSLSPPAARIDAVVRRLARELVSSEVGTGDDA